MFTTHYASASSVFYTHLCYLTWTLGSQNAGLTMTFLVLQNSKKIRSRKMFGKHCSEINGKGSEFKANRVRRVTWSPWFCSGGVPVNSFTGRGQQTRPSNRSAIIPIIPYISPSFVIPPQRPFAHMITCDSRSKTFWEVGRGGLFSFG